MRKNFDAKKFERGLKMGLELDFDLKNTYTKNDMIDIIAIAMSGFTQIRSITVNKEKKIVTVVFKDGDVRMSKCCKEDKFDVSVGVALAVSYRFFGSKTKMHKEIKRLTTMKGSK